MYLGISKMALIGFSLRFMTPSPLALLFSTRYDFPVVVWVLSTIRKILLMAMVWIHLTWVIMSCCVVVHRCYTWAGLLVASLPWKLIWYLLVAWKLVLVEGAFKSTPAQGPLGSTSQAHCVFSNTFLSSTSVEQPREITITYNVLGGLLDNPDQHLKRGLLMPWFGCFVLDFFYTCSIVSKTEISNRTIYECLYKYLYLSKVF